MYDSADKNSKFLEAINRAALKHCQALDEEIKRQTKEEIEKAEEKIHTECHEKMEKAIQKYKTATVRQLAKYSMEKHSALSRRRQEMETEIFDQVEKELKSYRATEAYQNSLVRSAEKMKPFFKEADDVVIYVSEEDLPFAPQIKKAFGGCDVKADLTNKTGGLKAESRKNAILIDDSLASRLEAQRQWFAENSGLKIV